MIGECVVTVDYDRQRVVTEFPGHLVVEAAPQVPEQVEHARSLGYAGTDEEAVWQMTAEHDLLHTVLAVASGEPWSPTLYSVASREPFPLRDARAEEGRVLMVQKLLNAVASDRGLEWAVEQM